MTEQLPPEQPTKYPPDEPVKNLLEDVEYVEVPPRDPTAPVAPGMCVNCDSP